MTESMPAGLIEFRVQGGAPDPYHVRFWLEGTNLRSSCTCEAGQRGLACKHRLSLLEGDVTALLHAAPAAVLQLRNLTRGTDVGAAFADYEQQGEALDYGAALLPLKPPGRRKALAPAAAAPVLTAGGLVKGNTSYFDIYDAGLQYAGSVKVRRGTVFSEKVADYFPGVPLTARRLTDGLTWERSQSVYAAVAASPIGNFLLSGAAQQGALRALKKAVSD